MIWSHGGLLYSSEKERPAASHKRNSEQKADSKELTGATPSVRGQTVTTKDSVTSQVVVTFWGQ